MYRWKGLFFMSLVLTAAILFIGGGRVQAQPQKSDNQAYRNSAAAGGNGGNGSGNQARMRRMTNTERWKAAIRNSDRRADHHRHQKGGKK